LAAHAVGDQEDVPLGVGDEGVLVVGPPPLGAAAADTHDQVGHGPSPGITSGGEGGGSWRGPSDRHRILPRVRPPGQGAGGTKVARDSQPAGDALVKSVSVVYTSFAARPGDTAMRFLEDVRVRHRRPEIMDQPGLDRGQHYNALRGLERINLVSNSAGIL